MPGSYRFVVKGRVQGVGFRQSTKFRADSLGLHGWVRNRTDGAVEGGVSGNAEALVAFHAFLLQGPPIAKVDAADWSATDESFDAGFSIR